MRAPARSLAYGLAGLAGELAFTGVRGRPRTSAVMLPVYALALPLFEPAHDVLRPFRPVVRAGAYALGFTAVEYASGRALRRVAGVAPWDYSHARGNLHGLVRPSYLPLWGAVGLCFERLHDALGSGAAAPRAGALGRDGVCDRLQLVR